MKFLLNYKMFNEALLPSQFRKYVKEFNKERYEDKFQKFKEKYDGDKNAYRIYLPYDAEMEKSETEKEIEELFHEYGYEIIDYISGTAKFKDAKNPSKIGKVLNSLLNKVQDKEKVESLIKKFVEDPIRKSGKEEMLVCISRHPYDIAGADTDREWTNCMTIGTTDSKKVRDLENKLEELDPENDKYKISEIKNKLSDIKRDGENVKYLLHDVKEGSLIAYLIKSTDKNINNPIANLNIKPYLNIKDENDFILISDDSMYGRGNDKFKKIVDDFLKEFNDNKKGLYCLNINLYSDNEKDYRLSNISLIELMKKTDKFNMKFTDAILHNLNIRKMIKGDSKEKNIALNFLKNIDFNDIPNYIENIEDWDDISIISDLCWLLYEIGNYGDVVKLIRISDEYSIVDDVFEFDFLNDLIGDILDNNKKEASAILKELMESELYEFDEIIDNFSYHIVRFIKILNLEFSLEKYDDYDYVIETEYGSFEFDDKDLYKKLLRNKNRVK
jgi:hypothetical protein